ncbi:MAG: CvpA family protein [Patescibacteria group bacterium]|jgi:uncharacterized membrane protein required for colicin V production
MSGFDIFLILVIAGFAFYGLFHGLIKTIGAIIALIVGVWIANLFYLPAYDLAKKIFFGFDTLGHVLVFMVLFVIANRLVNLVFVLIEGSYNSLFFIPFLKTINRLLGAIFGLILGGLIVGFSLYGLEQAGFLKSFLAPYLEGSQIAPPLLKYVGVIVPLLPNLWNKIIGAKDMKKPDAINFSSVKLEDFNLDKIKTTGQQLKESVWNTSK